MQDWCIFTVTCPSHNLRKYYRLTVCLYIFRREIALGKGVKVQSLISEKVELEIPMAGRMGMGNHLADRMVTGRRADIQVLLMKKT